MARLLAPFWNDATTAANQLLGRFFARRTIVRRLIDKQPITPSFIGVAGGHNDFCVAIGVRPQHIFP